MQTIIILLLLVALIAVAAAWFAQNGKVLKLKEENGGLASQQQQLREQLNATKLNIDKLEATNKQLNAEVLSLSKENARLGEQVNLTEKKQEELKSQSQLVFRDLANQIFTEQAKTFKTDNEQRIGEILNPFANNLDKFKKAIDDYQKTQLEYGASLQQQIKDLSLANDTLGKEAQDLTKALKGDSKIQGDWGEMVLARILELSGLREGVNYSLQVTQIDGKQVKNENGSYLRPDVVLFLPDKKNLIVDSKVSLTAFSGYVGASSPDEQKRFLKSHLDSVKKHVDELADKKYQFVIDHSADFVMMFIPNEAAYLLAMENDQSLWEYAYKKQIIIVSPTHLIAVVRLISQLWSREMQSKNAQQIADEAGKMLDKFAAFIKDFEDIQKNIASTQKAYDAAANKLHSGKGNLLARAQKLKTLGAKNTKPLPEADDNVLPPSDH